MNNMNADLPKVLVVSSTPFSKTKNNGKTLSSFFENYDKNLIAQFSYSGGDCNSDICDNYYFLTNDNVLKGQKGKNYHSNEILTTRGQVEITKTSLFRRLFHFFSLARNPLAWFIKDRIWRKADYSGVYAWIDEFKPDVVFFQGGSVAYSYDFVLTLCQDKELPLILELTDDYTQRLYPLSLFEKLNKSRYMSVFTKAINKAYKTIVISDLMKKEYEDRFGGDMDVMMNAVKIDRVDNQNIERPPNDYIYAGNLLLNRWKVLRNFGKALAKVNPSAILNIYTPDIPPKYILKALSKVNTIRYGGRLNKEELEQRLHSCEYVVHVEAFDKKNRKITRLSVSTKISEYMNSGALIIAIGPEDVASMQYLEGTKAAVCIFGSSCNFLEKKIKKINDETFLKKVYINNALELCETRHGVKNNTKRLQNILLQCVKK